MSNERISTRKATNIIGSRERGNDATENSYTGHPNLRRKLG
jgi:hypothetical protein